MDKKEVIQELESLADEIYSALDRMSFILKGALPWHLYSEASTHWMGRIDYALNNREDWYYSDIKSTLRDTIEAIEEMGVKK